MNYAKKSWTTEEETEMLSSIRKGEAFDRIAKQHDRTPNAIKLRFAMVCKKDLEKTTKSIHDLCREYNIKEEQLMKHINDLENIQQKNNTPTAPYTQQVSSFDLADISIIKEEIILINEKLEKIYKHVKKLTEISKKKKKKIEKVI
jgi:hypothetical protein